jgi:hypothetical protein
MGSGISPSPTRYVARVYSSRSRAGSLHFDRRVVAKDEVDLELKSKVPP